MIFFKKFRGQTLIEVLLALTIGTIVITGITSSVLYSLVNTRQADDRSKINHYLQEGMEVARIYRSRPVGTYCLAKNQANLNDPDGACSENNIDDKYRRSIQIISNDPSCEGNNKIIVKLEFDGTKCQKNEDTGKCEEVLESCANVDLASGQITSTPTSIPAPSGPYVEFTDSDDIITILTGQSANIAWSSKFASNCTTSGTWGNKSISTIGSESTGSMNSTGQYTYNIACTSAYDQTSLTDTLLVVVVDPTPIHSPTPTRTPTPINSPTPTRTPTPTPSPTPSSEYWKNTSGGNRNIRDLDNTTTSTVIGSFVPNDIGYKLSGPTVNDGYTWRRLQPAYSGDVGWVADNGSWWTQETFPKTITFFEGISGAPPLFTTAGCQTGGNECRRDTLVRARLPIKIQKIACYNCGATEWVIYRSDSNFSNSSLLGSGTTFTNSGSWREVTLSTPIQLQAGTYYIIGFKINVGSNTFRNFDGYAGHVISNKYYVDPFRLRVGSTGTGYVGVLGAFDIRLTVTP